MALMPTGHAVTTTTQLQTPSAEVESRRRNYTCSTILVDSFCQPLGLFLSALDSTSSSGGGPPMATSSQLGGLNPTFCNLSEHSLVAWKLGVARAFNPWIIVVATPRWRFQIIGRKSAQLDQCADSRALLAQLNPMRPSDSDIVMCCCAFTDTRDPHN